MCTLSTVKPHDYRARATVVLSLVFAALLAGCYGWVDTWPTALSQTQAGMPAAETVHLTIRSFLLGLIPGLVAILLGFVVVALSQGLGLWRRSDKLDELLNYVDAQRSGIEKLTRFVPNTNAIPWIDVVSSDGPLRSFCNFATIPFNIAAADIRAKLDHVREGHLFVFLNPESKAAVEEIATTRALLRWANDPASLDRAIRDSVAMLLELAPSNSGSLDRPLPGVRVVLVDRPVKYAAYWTLESAVFWPLESLPQSGLRGAPRVVMTGLASVQAREFFEVYTRELISEGAQPTIRALLDLSLPARDNDWYTRMERRFSTK